MLGLVGASQNQNFQPMTPFCDPDEGEIWFYSQKDSDLARAVAAGGEAMLIIQSKDQDFQACVSGWLAQTSDRGRIEQYWSPVVAAWFPEGKDDPNLTMLRFDASDAQIWLSKGGPIKFAWEIAKANATHEEPDLGVIRSVRLG